MKAACGFYSTIRTIWTVGFVALFDFVKAISSMAIRHQRLDQYYKKNDKFKKKPGLFSPSSKGFQEFENDEMENEKN